VTDEPIRIPRFPVSSSSIAAIGYLEAKKILAVEFAGGGVMHYAGVEPETAVDLLNADSIGRFYATMIRGKYWADKMTGRCPACGALGWIGDRCDDCGTATFTREERKVRGQHESATDDSAEAGDRGSV